MDVNTWSRWELTNICFQIVKLKNKKQNIDTTDTVAHIEQELSKY